MMATLVSPSNSTTPIPPDSSTLELPLVISTPHSSGFIPHDILYQMLGSKVTDIDAKERFLAYMFHEGDPYTDVIFHVPGACHLHALTSRFVVDLNRERGEPGENGVIKLTDFSKRPLYPESYNLSADSAEDRLRRYWDPYHHSYAEMLAQDHIRFFIDGHSMAAFGPQIGPDHGKPRPAFTIMTGGDTNGESVGGVATSIAPEIARVVAERLEHHMADYLAQFPDVPAEARLNDPFPFATISKRYSSYTTATPKPGFSLEVNRALYLTPREDGLSDVIPGSIETLNTRFAAFVNDIMPLFAHPPVAIQQASQRTS
ncbi:MAG: N-formylglutamate amidohydrolase [Deinococcota bacterium]